MATLPLPHRSIAAGLLTAAFVLETSCAAARKAGPAAPALPRVTTATGLVYEVVQPGSSDPARPGQTVFIHETLTVDGKQIFSSRDKNRPVKFLLGGNQVIPGVDQAVNGMRPGERRKVTVHPALDGRTFDPAFIRPTATRYYDIELVRIGE